MRFAIAIALAASAAGCTVERVGPPGVTITRNAHVAMRDVAVFETTDMVRERFWVVEELTVRDDGEVDVRELERELRVMAGARGANAIVLAPGNRQPNGTRAFIGLRLDDPFDSYSATAIWIGDTPPEVRTVGRIGGGA